VRLSGAMRTAAGLCALGVAAAVAPGRGGPLPARATVLIAPDFVRVGSPAATPNPPSTADCEQAFGIACYSPRQLEQAYGIPALLAHGVTGKGQTIVIVDSFGSPTIWHDLWVFDTAYHLPAPPSLTAIQPAGRVPPYQASSGREGWAAETSLDVEYAHVMAPGARILLVETPTSENEGTTGFPQIVKGEEYVVNHHLGGVISQSFSATEETFGSRQSLFALRGAYTDAAARGVTVLAASGDSGAADLTSNGSSYYLKPVTSWPDSDPLVTGVGATQLRLSAAGLRTAPDQVWNDTYNPAARQLITSGRGPAPLASGGGRSVMFARPAYQDKVQSVVGSGRGVPDISMSGACSGAVNVYQSFPGDAPGWYQVCGTSEATPLFAGVVSLADQVAGHPLGAINPRLYQLLATHAPGLVDVVAGGNTVSFSQDGVRHTVPGFTARPGYDLASGTGTVDAPLFVYELAGKRTPWPVPVASAAPGQAGQRRPALASASPACAASAPARSAADARSLMRSMASLAHTGCGSSPRAVPSR
jgi:subtilase family serine protease